MFFLALLHSEQPKLSGVLAVLSAIRLNNSNYKVLILFVVEQF